MEKKKLDSQTIDRINNSPIVFKSKSNFKVKKWKKKYKKLDKKYTNAVKELDDLKADTYDEIESLKILSEAKDEEIVRLRKKVDDLTKALNDIPPNYLESKHSKNLIQDRDRRIKDLEFELGLAKKEIENDEYIMDKQLAKINQLQNKTK